VPISALLRACVTACLRACVTAEARLAPPFSYLRGEQRRAEASAAEAYSLVTSMHCLVKSMHCLVESML
jgi:hypothetical protein